MKRLFKKNRNLFVLCISTVVVFIFGILFYNFIGLESKNVINNNVVNLIENLKNDNISTFTNFGSLILSNSLIIFISNIIDSISIFRKIKH